MIKWQKLMILAFAFGSDDCCHKYKLLYRPAVAEWLQASRSSSFRLFLFKWGRPPNSTTSSNGSLLLLARRHPGGSLPFLPILRCHPPAGPPPADRFRGPALALSAMAPRSPLLLRLLHLFLTPAAGTARGARRLRGTCTSSSWLPPIQTNAREKTRAVAHTTNTSCRTRHLICLFPTSHSSIRLWLFTCTNLHLYFGPVRFAEMSSLKVLFALSREKNAATEKAEKYLICSIIKPVLMYVVS
jgi:hypothetical protein